MVVSLLEEDGHRNIKEDFCEIVKRLEIQRRHAFKKRQCAFRLIRKMGGKDE